MKTIQENAFSRPWLKRLLAIAAGTTLCMLCATGFAQESNSSALSQGLANGTNQARQKISETSQAAAAKIQTLWERIDEKRLKNRTPDQIVAWLIMGMLAGGLLYRFGRRGQLTSILLGLIGAFIGGIIANVSKLDLGLGPVLITYEDLLFTLAGAVLIICGVRWSTILKLFKP